MLLCFSAGATYLVPAEQKGRFWNDPVAPLSWLPDPDPGISRVAVFHSMISLPSHPAPVQDPPPQDPPKSSVDLVPQQLPCTNVVPVVPGYCFSTGPATARPGVTTALGKGSLSGREFLEDSRFCAAHLSLFPFPRSSPALHQPPAPRLASIRGLLATNPKGTRHTHGEVSRQYNSSLAASATCSSFFWN